MISKERLGAYRVWMDQQMRIVQLYCRYRFLAKTFSSGSNSGFHNKIFLQFRRILCHPIFEFHDGVKIKSS
jgi:hypothetical protein